MKELLAHPWIRVLIIATTVAMVSMALRETSPITGPIIAAIYDVLLPVAIGFVIAYVLTPVVDLFSRHAGLGRAVTTSIIFASAIGLFVLVMALAVPPVVRQGSGLVQQAISGEPYTDANRNGVYDDGEAFADRNRNGRRDGALVGGAIAWVEAKQAHLQRLSGAPPTDEGHAMVLAFAVVRDEQIAQVAGSASLAAPVTATAAAGNLVHTALRSVRGLAEPGADSRLVAELRQRIRATATGEATVAAARAVHARLEADERAGDAAAGAVLDLIPRGEAGHAGQLDRTMTTVESGLTGWLNQLPERMASWAASAAGSFGQATALLIDAILVPIYAFFLILLMPVLRERIKASIPRRHRDQVLSLVREIERAVAAFFRGRLIICSACAGVGVVGFLVTSMIGVGTPYGILFGIGIGLATVIPLAGILLLVPAVLLTWLQPGATGLDLVLVVVVYALIQGVEAVLIPVVMGREVELHPIALIIALLLCGKLLGVLGLILAVPIAATARILARVYLWPRLAAWAASGMDAVQPPPPDAPASARLPRP